jgi:lipopolysaccharide export system permease protein
VFKKLDKLVIKAFIGPFIATFFITLLVLVMQFFWLYIDDFAGKGLETHIILEFIWYQSAALVPLALPLAVLLASLMTFGNLGESFELVALKSSGISLLRFMRPLFFVAVLICGVAFAFSNNIIPVANLKSRTLLVDIVKAKPSFDIREGVFYDKIAGYAIKIGKKEKNDSVIHDVIIYEQGNTLQDNFIVARKGVMRTMANKRFLELTLQDGWRYQEKTDNTDPGITQYIRLHFKEYKKQFDLSSFQFNRTADSLNRNNEKMLSMRQLKTAIDSLEKELRQLKAQQDRENFRQLQFVAYMDSSWQMPQDFSGDTIKNFASLLPDSARRDVYERASAQLNSLKTRMEISTTTYGEKERILIWHKIEWHRKISLSVACLVLFLIGAPLGAIIRKGGFGTPMLFAIIFFMVFYFSGTTGEKFARQGTLTPFAGMWQSTFVLLPIGLFLTYKALHDSQLFNKEFYFRFRKKISRLINSRKKERKTMETGNAKYKDEFS